MWRRAPAPPAVADIVCASAVGLAALSLYIATLQPDFGGPEDTPKFQFVGYVLGSAHPPGYPLYVLLSHAFVQIPIRTIAYRANLFSAVMAATACIIGYAIARQVGAGRVASICAALALATGAAFWRSAVFAEVYSLAAVLSGLTVCLLLSWGTNGRLSGLIGAAAIFALGLGNHLTIVGLAPACALYVVIKNRRVLTPRVVAALRLILLVGLSQYGLIVLRTRQAAPYMESRADSVSELWRVVTAEHFAAERFAFGPRVLLTVHLPAALRVLGRDLGALGVVLCLAGIAGLALTGAALSRPDGEDANGSAWGWRPKRMDRAAAALLLGSVLGLLAMVVNLSGDLQGFVTPLLPLLWPLSAVGAEYVAHVLVRPKFGPAIASVIAWALVLAMPAWNVASNYRFADQSDQREEGRFLRAFYSQLPDRAGVVAQDYHSDMAVNYMMFTGEGGPDRGVTRVGFSGTEVRGALGDGRRVFAFAAGATILNTEGFRFERTLVNGPPLDEWLDWLPRHTLVVGATAHVPFQLDVRRIGHGAARPMGRLRSYEAFAVVTDTPDAQWRNGDGPVSVRPFDAPVTATSDEGGARIERDGHTIARVNEGLALATVMRDGSVTRPLEFPSGESMNVPYQQAVYEITGTTPCAMLTDSWRDVTPTLATGSWVATLHERGTASLEIAIGYARDVKANASVLLGNGTATGVTQRLHPDRTMVLSLQLTRNGDYRPVFRFVLDHIPGSARARIVGGSITTLSVCSHEPLASLFSSTDRTLLRPDFEAEPYFGAGWSSAERTTTGRQRRGERGAALFLPLVPRYAYSTVFELDAPTPTWTDVLVNGAVAGRCEIAGPGRCPVDLPEKSVREGVNTITFEAGPPQQPTTFTLHRVELSRRAPRAPPS